MTRLFHNNIELFMQRSKENMQLKRETLHFRYTNCEQCSRSGE